MLRNAVLFSILLGVPLSSMRTTTPGWRTELPVPSRVVRTDSARHPSGIAVQEGEGATRIASEEDSPANRPKGHPGRTRIPSGPDH